MNHPLDALVQSTLEHIRAQLAVVEKRQLTQEEFGVFAGFDGRRMGDWLRGTNKAQPMIAVMQLLSRLPESGQREVLEFWKRQAAPLPFKSKSRKKKR